MRGKIIRRCFECDEPLEPEDERVCKQCREETGERQRLKDKAENALVPRQAAKKGG